MVELQELRGCALTGGERGMTVRARAIMVRTRKLLTCSMALRALSFVLGRNSELLTI